MGSRLVHEREGWRGEGWRGEGWRGGGGVEVGGDGLILAGEWG